MSFSPDCPGPLLKPRARVILLARPDAVQTHGKGGVNAAVFIECLKRLIAGAKHEIFLIVDRGLPHIAKKTRPFTDSLKAKLQLFYLPPYSPDRNPDELVWKPLKVDTAGRMAVTSRDGFKRRVRSSMRQRPNDPAKIISFFQKPSLKYAA